MAVEVKAIQRFSLGGLGGEVIGYRVEVEITGEDATRDVWHRLREKMHRGDVVAGRITMTDLEFVVDSIHGLEITAILLVTGLLNWTEGCETARDVSGLLGKAGSAAGL